MPRGAWGYIRHYSTFKLSLFDSTTLAHREAAHSLLVCSEDRHPHCQISGSRASLRVAEIDREGLHALVAGQKPVRRAIRQVGRYMLFNEVARDIGAVCAEVLSGEGHAGQSYEITGPELLTFYDAADRFSEVLGEKVEYVAIPMDQFREKMTGLLVPWHLNAVCELFREIAEIGLDHTTDTFKELIGRDPRSLKQFIEDHMALFR